MELFFDAAGGYPFTTTSSALPGVVRKFNSVADCVEEICDSRLYGGIHFLQPNDRPHFVGQRQVAWRCRAAE
jgi:hypothetical protein